MITQEKPQTIEINRASEFHHLYVSHKDLAFDGYLPILIDDNIMFISDFKGTYSTEGTVKTTDVTNLTHSNFVNFKLEDNDPKAAEEFEYEVTAEQEAVIRQIIATTAQEACKLKIQSNR